MIKGEQVVPSYPWLSSPWQILVNAWQAEKLTHALMLIGEPGIGRYQLARDFIQLINCKHPQQARPCGQCEVCHLLTIHAQPDHIELASTEEQAQLKIDEVRELSQNLLLAPQLGRYRTAIIYPAHALNKASANALLKTLEEPGANTLLILITHCPHLLPATLRSRCQKVYCQRPSAVQTQQWLQQFPSSEQLQLEQALPLAKGAPLLALEYQQQGLLAELNALQQHLADLLRDHDAIISVANQSLVQLSLAQIVDFIQSWLTVLIRYKVLAIMPGDSGMQAFCKQCAPQLAISKIFQFHEQLLSLKQKLQQRISLNSKLSLTRLLWQWANCRAEENQ